MLLRQTKHWENIIEGGGGDSALHTYIYDHYRYVKVYVYSIYYDIRTNFIDAGNPSQKAIRFCKNTYKV